jgi:carboxypeptidase C (cathepsin A)
MERVGASRGGFVLGSVGMRAVRRVVATAALMTLAAMGAARAEPAVAPASAAQPPASDESPLPAEASAHQQVTVGGRRLDYTATVGKLPVVDDMGKTIGEVVFTAYRLDGAGLDRPVTFAFNGGPGAAAAYLNFGAIGPKTVRFGTQGDSLSAGGGVTDNPGTWLDFTDLVFIDPIGTGFSRSLLPKDEAVKRFYSLQPDIDYLSQVVADWLTRYGRLSSPKYIVGESYGGFRAPRIAHRLQLIQGVGVSGLVMISPLLDWGDRTDPDVSIFPWVARLPSMAAARLEQEGRLTPAAVAPAEAYARGDFALDLLKGRSDPAAQGRLADQVSALTGLDHALVASLGGRVDPPTYLRERFRTEGRIASIYDANVTSWDPFPRSAQRRADDPILGASIAPISAAASDLVTRTLGWKAGRAYTLYNRAIDEAWLWGDGKIPESLTDLRQALALDPNLKVLIAHGYTDVITPYFGSRLMIDQFPPMGDPGRLRLAVYPGGHMFYARPDSRMALHRDVEALFLGAPPPAAAGR